MIQSSLQHERVGPNVPTTTAKGRSAAVAVGRNRRPRNEPFAPHLRAPNGPTGASPEAWNAFVSKPVSEADVDRELARAGYQVEDEPPH